MLALLIFTITIVIILVVISLKNDVTKLRQELRGLQQKVDLVERSLTPKPPVARETLAVVEEKQQPVPAVQVPKAVVATPDISIPIQPVPRVEPSPTQPTRTRAEWEILIGGKFLNRIGALALIIGMAFFLKYAFDKNWITEWMRVIIGVGVGAVMLLGGARFHRKGLPVFAQGLVAAGIAILYLSVYATFNFYHLVSQPVAFVLMAAVTVLTFTQAFYYDALAVSFLGWLGGFLTPFLLSTGEARPVGLFSYIAMLDIGLIAILIIRKKWQVLAPFSLLATYFIYYLWYASSAGDGDGAVAVVFLGVFWLLFHLYDIAVVRQRDGDPGSLRLATAIAHVVIMYPGLYLVMDRYYPSWFGATGTIILAALYAGTGGFLWRSFSGRIAGLALYAISAIVLLAIGLEIQLGDFVVIVGYVIEAVVVFWIGRRLSLTYVWGGALGVLLWSCLVLLVTDGALFFGKPEEFVLFWNLRVMAFLSIAAGAALMILLFREDTARSAGVWRTILHCVLAFGLILMITTEVSDYYRRLLVSASDRAYDLISYQRYLTLGLLWLGLGVLLALTGHRTRVAPQAYVGFGFVVLGTCLVSLRGIAFDPITLFVPVLNVRTLILLIASGLLAVCLWNVGRDGEPTVWKKMQEWGVNPAAWLRVMLVIVTLVLVSGEIRDYFEHAIARPGEGVAISVGDLENMQQMFLSSGWLVYSIALMIVGLVQRMRSVRIIAIVLFGVAILKIFFYDLSFLDTLYRIVSFIGLGMILMVVSYLYQRYRGLILEDSH
jgi:uncharacterized membrane protein